MNFLDDYTLDTRVQELFKEVIIEFANDTAGSKDYKQALVKELTGYNNRLSRARELLLLGDLDGVEYKDIKST